MVVESEAGAEHKFTKRLLVKQINGFFVELLVVRINFRRRVAIGVAAVEEEVGAEGQVVAGEERNGLVGGQAGRVVRAVEEIGLHRLVCGMAVVDDVVAPVVVQVDVAARLFVLVAEGKDGHAAGYVGVGVEHRSADGARILRVGPDEADARAGLPGVVELVPELRHSAGGIEGGVVAVACGTVRIQVDGGGEAAALVGVGKIAPEGADGTSHQFDPEVVPVVLGLAGDDVDGAAHGVGAVEDGGCAAGNLDALGVGGHILVGDRVAVDGLELGMSVYQDDDAAAARAEAAQGDRARCAAGDTVAADVARSDEQARDLLHQDGHHGAFIAVRDRGARNNGHRRGKRIPKNGNTRPGHDGTAQGIGFFRGVGQSGRAQAGREEEDC